jgi:hypoxanthine phosphoribosyltransferase
MSTVKSYDYANRKGIRRLSWDDFAALAIQLAENLSDVELIIGIARGGLFPATVVACSLRRELYPVRVTRRVEDEVRFASPVWRVPVPDEVAGKNVVVVDDIADSGETLELVAARVRELGAAQIRTASLVSHTWAKPMPDVCPLISDELILFPWDQKVYINGQWQTHPEVTAAIKAQNKDNPA